MLDECFGLKSFSDSNDERDIGASEEFSDLVGHRHYDGDWEAFYATSAASAELVPIKTHLPPVDDAKAIYLLRDPRAAIVSLHHYYHRYGRLDFTLEDVAFGATGFGPWAAHLDAWRPKKRPDTLFLRYEDITAAPEDAVMKVSAFLKKKPLRSEPPSFANLKSANPDFFRTGSNTKNIAELSPDQDALISYLFAAHMRDYGYAAPEVTDVNAVKAKIAAFASAAFKEKQALRHISLRQETLTQKVESLRDKLERSHAKNADLRDQRKDALSRNRSLQSECAVLHGEVAAERDAAARFGAEREHFEKRALKAERALSPRLKSILTFAPMRFALAEWGRIKAGGEPWRPLQLSAVSRHGQSGAWVEKRSVDGLLSAVKKNAAKHNVVLTSCGAQSLGIAVFAYDRADNLVNVLEALTLQGAAPLTHVFIDGDQGRPAKRADIDLVHECAKRYPVKAIHRNNGNFGFRKMMLLAMRAMMETYERIVFLEDDCFPVRGAIEGFDSALDAVAEKPDVFSVYGHPFLFSGEENGSARFQGWGWATTAPKLRPVWEQLMECYLMSEEDYLAFVDRELTPDIEEAIDVTPGRLPSDTIRRFFAWDETLCLLTAIRGLRHQRTSERLIYNFGAGGKSSHFHDLQYFRKPPFNMISIDEVWDHY
ncbi:MAG: hypothetical protein DHS20C04_20230 [Hyphococcus sp.]|nr:MAG: hypothetical protein DHS20C04_20230 [Marinicaulis sp.]